MCVIFSTKRFHTVATFHRNIVKALIFRIPTVNTGILVFGNFRVKR